MSIPIAYFLNSLQIDRECSDATTRTLLTGGIHVALFNDCWLADHMLGLQLCHVHALLQMFLCAH